MLVVFTALVGRWSRRVPVGPMIAFTAILFSSRLAAVPREPLEHVVRRGYRAVCGRTAKRPVPAGKVTWARVWSAGPVAFGGLGGDVGLATNWLAAGLLAFTIFSTQWSITIWAEAREPWNHRVIGGAAGALSPDDRAAVAATGSVSLEALADCSG